jgi:magnesium transporter
MIRIHRCDGTRWQESEGAAALASVEGGGPAWVEVVAPDAAELAALHRELNLHELALKDALAPGHPPVFHEFDSYLFAIVHAPESSDTRTTKKAAFFLGERFVVTVLRAPLPLLQPLIERMRRHPDHYLAAPERIAHAILAHMTDVFEQRVDELIDRTDKIEDEVLEKTPDGLLKRLHGLRRRTAHFARVVRTQRDVCQAIARGDTGYFSRDVAPGLRDVADHMLRIYDLLEAVRDGILAARDSYLTAVSNQLNVTMKTLTAVATILLPLGLVAGIFGMNVDPIPLGHVRYGFWIVVAGMLAAALGLAWWFRRRRWL